MHIPDSAASDDPRAQRHADRRRWLRAFNLSLASVLGLLVVFWLQAHLDLRGWAVQPGSAAGLKGLLGAPLLHGSFEHLAANAIALLLLGTLAAGLYPRACARTVPLAWLGSGVGAWLLGEPGSYHLGASGVTHGLMFLVFFLGLLRRDRAAVAAAMIAFFLFGGMLMTVLPREAGVSWQAHLGGAAGGLAGALLWRRLDPAAARRRYSWEIEEEDAAVAGAEALEPPSPDEVPVIWDRPPEERGVVLPFRRRDP
ncbi:rhomboid family intramembrane serine protease [Lysobacter sp. GX 14042]|uniref:rhomboid family intramembrane serine protease n=1 Tax=Lysobacter sp. GX 14042 TaxID=2907155 RepID=UPI001F38AAC3|nr:rhomboid family intramembrane serine protease [Lysobacter sp. GX 14042]MCE7032321.1 rhomboid family intramembrane serine protease [Lysobacter sp. GX 14042]